MIQHHQYNVTTILYLKHNIYYFTLEESYIILVLFSLFHYFSNVWCCLPACLLACIYYFQINYFSKINTILKYTIFYDNLLFNTIVISKTIEIYNNNCYFVLIIAGQMSAMGAVISAREIASSTSCSFMAHERLSYAFSVWRMDGDWNANT